MKKILAVIFLCVYVSAPLIGCQIMENLGLAPRTTQTVTIWNYYNGDQKVVFDELVSEFNRTRGKDSNIVLESISKADTNELNRQILAGARHEQDAGPLPDIAFIYSDVAYTLAQMDMLVDYSTSMSSGALSNYVPGFLNEGRIFGDERVFILPVAKSTEVLFLNKTDFDKFAYEVGGTVSYDSFNTWEGIIDAAGKYYDWLAPQTPGGLPEKALFGLDSVANFIFSSHRQLDAQLLQINDGIAAVDFTTGAFPVIWKTYYEPMVKGHFAAYGRFRSDDFRTGDILAYLGSTANGSYLSNQVVRANGISEPVEIMAFPMPVYKNGRPVAIQQGAGAVTIKSTPERQAAAISFIQWFTEPQRNTDFATRSSYMPVTNEAIENLSKLYAKNPASDIIGISLTAAIKQLSAGYEMYSPPPYENAYEVRRALEGSLANAVKDNRSLLTAEAAATHNYAGAVKKYLDIHNYEKFLDNCISGVASNGVNVVQ